MAVLFFTTTTTPVYIYNFLDMTQQAKKAGAVGYENIVKSFGSLYKHLLNKFGNFELGRRSRSFGSSFFDRSWLYNFFWEEDNASKCISKVIMMKNKDWSIYRPKTTTITTIDTVQQFEKRSLEKKTIDGSLQGVFFADGQQTPKKGNNSNHTLWQGAFYML